MHISEQGFHLAHHKSISNLERALHKFRLILLNTEISDVNRTIDLLTKKLSHISRKLSGALPTYIYIWNNITKHHFRSYNNLYEKFYLSHKEKFFWLLQKSYT